MKREHTDWFLLGVLCALGHLYAHGEDTLAEEIIYATGKYALLRVAKKNEDLYLPNLRKSIRYLNEKHQRYRL